jgi:hypothetical protein
MILRIVSALATVALTASSVCAQTPIANPLVGTWKLIAAEKILPDGTRVTDYGPEPHGLAIFTADGHYMLDVFRDVRPKFAGKDREKATFEEYKEAQLNSSCAFGTYSVNTSAAKVILHVDRSSYPNNDDTTVIRDYELKDNTVSWRVAPRPDGSIPITVLRRIDAQEQGK